MTTVTDEPEPVDTPEPAEAPTMAGEDAPLTALDRCDRCGAQAYVRAMVHRDATEIVSGNITRPGELLFCAHHAKMHKSELIQVAERMYDETARLTTPIVSSY